MANDEQVRVTKTEARGGSKNGVTRYVLGASLALIVVLFGLVLLYWA